MIPRQVCIAPTDASSKVSSGTTAPRGRPSHAPFNQPGSIGFSEEPVKRGLRRLGQKRASPTTHCVHDDLRSSPGGLAGRPFLRVGSAASPRRRRMAPLPPSRCFWWRESSRGKVQRSLTDPQQTGGPRAGVRIRYARAGERSRGCLRGMARRRPSRDLLRLLTGPNRGEA